VNAPTQKALAYVANLTASGFWGFVTLKFEAGEVVHVRREENLKPASLPETDRSQTNEPREQTNHHHQR
jgi:hypothetical protein